jgi:hypothetical protein
MINNLYTAVRPAAFIGFLATCDQKERERLVQDFVKKTAPDLKFVLAGCVHKGQRDKRSLTPVAYAEFAAADDARTFTDKFKNNNADLGKLTVDVRPARTQLHGQRNYSLRQASDKLKAEAPTKSVQINWRNRDVSVGNATAFKRGRDEIGGSFLGAFSHLTLGRGTRDHFGADVGQFSVLSGASTTTDHGPAPLFSEGEKRPPPQRTYTRQRRSGQRSYQASLTRRRLPLRRSACDQPAGGEPCQSGSLSPVQTPGITLLHLNLRGFISHRSEL